MHNVFVYGSLKQGFGNHRLLSFSQFLGEATTKDSHFSMISLGGFPGVFDDGESRISGEVYRVNDSTLRNLDGLESEGSFYSRRTYPMRLSNGEVIDCYIYILLERSLWLVPDDMVNRDKNSGNTLIWSLSREVEPLAS